MPVDVSVYALRGNGRSQRIARALFEGIRAAGDRVRLYPDSQPLSPKTDVVAFYGFEKELPSVMRECLATGRKVVFVDLGYWARREGGRWSGYHKVAVDGRHPGAYFRARKHEEKRARKLGVVVRPWRKGGSHILLAGMSAKSALSYGLEPEAWERAMAAQLRQHTDRPIVYRPKPSWREASTIQGTTHSHASEPLGSVLTKCHAVVTHHSNVAVDALVEGIPVFCWDGVATCMGLQDVSRIETPWRPDDREQWVADVAYCQWNVKEIRAGDMWQHLKSEALIP